MRAGCNSQGRDSCACVSSRVHHLHAGTSGTREHVLHSFRSHETIIVCGKASFPSSPSESGKGTTHCRADSWEGARDGRLGQRAWLSWESACLTCMKRWVQAPASDNKNGGTPLAPALLQWRQEDQKLGEEGREEEERKEENLGHSGRRSNSHGR